MLISITGPSGIGKGFVKQAILEHCPKIKELPWTTTRPIRRKEANRIFVSLDRFQKMTAGGELILVQQLFGHSYGLQKCLFEADLDQVLLTELHIENLLKLSSLDICPVAIGLIPVSLEFLRQRLELYRATEKPAEIELRLQAAETEIQQILDNHELFLTVIEIAKSTEENVTQSVIETLTPHLKGGFSNEP